MTKDEIIAMAREVCSYDSWWLHNEEKLERFAELVAAAEREALAQKDEQEPVAEITADDMGRPFNAIRIGAHFYKEIPPVGTKLYTAPPTRKPMTEGEIDAIAESMPGGLKGFCVGWGWQQFAREIERAHGIGGEA